MNEVHRDFAGGRHMRPFTLIDDKLDGFVRQELEWLTHRRKGETALGRRRHVIEADHRNLSRDPVTPNLELAHCGEGHLVIRRHDRVELEVRGKSSQR